ncbi:MAG: phosphodiester glycosidase family protein [Bacteroidia bacterium]|nr:phosphodiester glycosidase family protein [Bacteroidia bacterium]
MEKRHILWLTIGILIAVVNYYSVRGERPGEDNERILSYVLDPAQQDLDFYWKDSQGEIYGNFENLKKELEKEGKKLTFAMNGGMYLKDQTPQGLFIEKGLVQKKLDDKQEGYGNFYLQPNGVFYLDQDNKAGIVRSSSFKHKHPVKYATQSGPMLVIEGALHPAFREGSENLHIRNGVGLLEDGKLLFAISKNRINFFDFASFFKEQGCRQALYLDGFVSRMYLPEKGYEQMDGAFGVIIAESQPARQ